MKFQIIKGAISHIISWVKSPHYEIVLRNPKFDHVNHMKGTVIYCVHGAVDRAASFKYISENIMPGLPDSIASIVMVAFEKRLNGKSITFYANQLIQKIIKNKHDNIILMGHSMGGIVAAKAAEELKNKNIRVISVITICSPLKGTPRIIAPFQLLAKSLNEMMPESKFLVELEKKIRQNEISSPHAINYLFISSSHDVICPADVCVIPSTIFKSHHVENEGHLSVMNSQQVVKIINTHISKLMSHTILNDNHE